MTTPYIDPNLIFAENAPTQDKPAAFQNYDKGWDASRSNDGRPLIPQMNYLTQQADLKNLYIHENGAALPYKDGITYEENAVVVKDGVLQQWKGGEWAQLNSASVILDASGENQQDINDYTGAKWRNKAGGYDLNARVMLDNGDIVRSTVAGNTVDPNVDMTGWVNVNSASQVFSASGLSVEDVNARQNTELNITEYLTVADFNRLQNLDRNLDITDYLKALIAEYSSKRTNASDTYGSSQGLLKIRLPKGVYTIRPDEIKISGAYGFQVEGDGVSTTVILCKSDTGVFFDFTPYLNIKFKDLSIIHQPVSSDRSNWTNSLFKLNGYGGGRRFKLDSVYVVGFNRQLDFVSQGNANEDTTFAENCAFTQYKTFLYSRSSQAVNNSFTRCSWSGIGDRTFDVSNYGHTQISDSGVVVAGSFFHLGSHPTFYGPTAQFTFTNVKFEWYNSSGTNVNGTTKIISTDDDITIAAYFKLIKCGIAGGSGDQTVNHFDLKAGNIVVDVDGGEWEGVNIGLKAFTVGDNVRNRSWVRFANCARSPNTTVNRTFASNSSVAPAVIFKNNRGMSDIVNIGSGTSGEEYLLSNDLINKNTATNQQGRLITGNTTETHAIPSYGQLVMIDKVRVMIKSSVGATSASVKLYLTSDKSTLIEEVPIVDQATPQAISFASAVGLTTADGIYVEVVNSNANINIRGFVIAETVSI